MENLNKISEFIAEKLSTYNPIQLDYGNDKVVGFANEINGNDLVIYIKKSEAVMTFGYQNAHFSLDDISSLIIHTEKYLKSEICSLEFFINQNSAFGGSRDSSLVKLDTIENIVNSYALDNEKAKQGLYEAFKKNDYNVRAISFNGKINNISYIHFNGEKFEVTVIK